MTRVRFRITHVKGPLLGLRRGENSMPEEPQEWVNVNGQELQVCVPGVHLKNAGSRRQDSKSGHVY